MSKKNFSLLPEFIELQEGIFVSVKSIFAIEKTEDEITLITKTGRYTAYKDPETVGKGMGLAPHIFGGTENEQKNFLKKHKEKYVLFNEILDYIKSRKNTK